MYHRDSRVKKRRGCPAQATEQMLRERGVGDRGWRKWFGI